MDRKAEVANFSGQISCLFNHNYANSPETGNSHEYIRRQWDWYVHQKHIFTESLWLLMLDILSKNCSSQVLYLPTHIHQEVPLPHPHHHCPSGSSLFYHTSEIMQSKALMNPKFEPCIFQPVKFECLRCKGDRYRSDSKKVWIILWQKQESRFFFKGEQVYISFIAVKHYSLFRVRGTFCMFYRGQCRMEPRK